MSGAIPKFSGFTTKLNEKKLAAALEDRRVLAGMEDLADSITKEVKRETSKSRYLRPFGKKMSTDRVRTGKKSVRIRVGTSWGPAVPIEYGTYNTVGQRILTTAAENAAGKIGGF